MQSDQRTATAVAVPAAATTESTKASPSSAAPRRDIQALRAIAVALVVVYHFWPARLTGGYVGVDVFFVISGFLITLHLLERPIARPRDLFSFWARRVRRLIPAASLVLVVTLAATLLWLPETVHARVAGEVIASNLYVENWLLAFSSTDYLATDQLHSPTQHYWSLSVEEQFYILWPVLIGATYLVGRRLRWSSSRAPLVVISVLSLASLAWSVLFTHEDPAQAYFVTTTRVWELGVGATLAAAVRAGLVSGSRRLRVPLVWAGLAAIVVSAVSFSGSTPFPGAAALLPTLGAAAVIAARSDDLVAGPRRLWSGRRVQWLGDVSYSVYLWHWPAVVIAPFVIGEDLVWWQKVAIIVLVLALSGVSKKWVEDAMRFTPRLARSTRRSFALLAVCLAVTSGLAAAALVSAERAASASEQVVIDPTRACLGVDSVRSVSCADKEPSLLVSPLKAAKDKPDVYGDHCWNNRPFTGRRTCEYGPTDAPVKVALYGNSHAGQWQPPIAKTIEQHGWRLDTYLASECYAVDIPVSFAEAGLTDNCLRYNEWARSRIVSGGYDLVIMSNRTSQALQGVPASQKSAVAGRAYERVIDAFVASGAKVLVIRDTPAAAGSVPDCVAQYPDDLEKCATPVRTGLEPDPLAKVASARRDGNVAVFDATDLLCREGSCPAVIGGLITYFDHGHMTKTFALTLFPEVSKAIRAVIDSGPGA